MRDPTPVTIHLKDYTPPAFLIATVDLDVDIRDEFARVRAKLAVKRNPAANGPPGAARPRRRRGRARVGRDRRPDARGRRIHARRRASDDRVGAGRVHPRDRGADRAAQEHEADGALRLEGRLLHPVRGGGLPPHHVLPRSPGRDGALHDDDSRRSRKLSGAVVERESGRTGRRGGRPALGEVGRPVPEAVVPLRDGGGEARQARGRRSSRARGARRRCRSGSSPARSTSAPGRCRRSGSR